MTARTVGLAFEGVDAAIDCVRRYGDAGADVLCAFIARATAETSM